MDEIIEKIKNRYSKETLKGMSSIQIQNEVLIEMEKPSEQGYE